MNSNCKYYLLILFGLCFQVSVAKAQLVIENNLIKNPGLEDLIAPKELQLEVGVGLRSLRRSTSMNLDVDNITRVSVGPLKWRKFCFFNGTAFAAIDENHARSGDVYMRLRVHWGIRSNRVSGGNIAASLHQPMEPGCDYRFGIWVARSPDDPERINNVSLRIKGLQGKVRALKYSPQDTAYLEFNIPIHEMEVGEYRYYEGVFTALSDDTHIYLEANTDEFVFGRKARRIHRRCSKMRGGCHSIPLASIIFDDVSLVDISGCHEKLFKEAEEMPEEVVEVHELISFSQLSSDWVQQDTARFYFHHDYSYMSQEELDRFMQYFEDFEGRMVSIHGYTDSTGGYSYNKELSTLRASYISDHLQEMGMDQQLEVSGMGPCNDSSCNSLEECRRVEVIWVPRKPSQEDADGES